MDFKAPDHTALHRVASVLVLHNLSNDSLILTRRSLTLKNHPGEVCFPGGRWQEGDKDLLATALRELQEELAIASSRIKSPRLMSPELTLSGFLIYPWFATIEALEPYSANSEEVLDVFNVPLQDVRKLEHYQEITVNRGGIEFKSCLYTACSHVVWGATARIMKQLCDTKNKVI
ncbi:NUDIX hydrolase [Legionella clemsonensis]|uniref:Putative NUDIX hydrolase n=1 Tax=Legionella clemsonensis TaxID=1867846 RepID=A0A222P299_9GAMM|nr:CoA pyrophosphatase [Legionella clemsonensis]ASQ45959.1 putative NUDIX hydrolase [Legionella clemsonensis]